MNGNTLRWCLDGVEPILRELLADADRMAADRVEPAYVVGWLTGGVKAALSYVDVARAEDPGQQAGAAQEGTTMTDTPFTGERQSLMSDEITGITVAGLHLLDDDGISSAPVFFPAETIDQLMAAGSWGRGKLHGLRVAPPPHLWPPRWRVLAEPPD